MIDTSFGVPISEELVKNYFKGLVNCFFKILPIRESGEQSLGTYMQSLQVEIAGSGAIIDALNNDEGLMELLSILQYLIDNSECPVKTVKREVFKAINICNKLQSQFASAV